MTLLRKSKNRVTRRLAQLSLRGFLLTLKLSFGASCITALSLWAALPLCAAQIFPSPANPQTGGSGSAPFAGALVSEWRGSVQVQIPGSAAGRPVRGQILPEGTTLETYDGQMMLVLRADESEVLIQPHTRVVLRSPQPGNWDALQILLGRIRAFIQKRTGGAPEFQMGSPSAVIAVRGTRFDVEVDRSGVTEVDVFEGVVEVGSSSIPGESVLIHPGMSTRVGMGERPEPPVPTREIRPDVEAPDQMAKLEFAREKDLQLDRTWDTEFGERNEIEADELVDESRESETGKH